MPSSPKVAFVSVEVAPFAKVGGLADVACSLPVALREKGSDCRTFMPGYPLALSDPRLGAKHLRDFRVEVHPGWHEWVSLHEGSYRGVPIYLIGSSHFEGATSSDKIYTAGSAQYLLFSKAVIEAFSELEWIPDVVHANDWHTGFIPVMLREQHPDHEGIATVYTIHNLAYQGEFGIEVLDEAGLPRCLFNMHQVEAYGAVNFLKSGCAYADQVNTVSPTYAREIQTPQYGCRLEGLMAHLNQFGRLSGILNGIDQDEWNPAEDYALPAHFSPASLEGKATCKLELLKEVGLPTDASIPTFGVVSRLSNQKGMDLILGCVDALLDSPANLIIQGLGDPWLDDQFRLLAKKRPDRFAFVPLFDADRAQRIYAGCDFFLMPSAFEPCGLGQMIALRYGTVPIVRRTGGLADSIIEGENGFVFEDQTAGALMQCIERALAQFSSPSWQSLVVHCLNEDFGWSKSADAYLGLYDRALHHRRAHSPSVV
ncbi:MAG TPA: glycogen/starch synthase [Fimbriimonadaceae bacterium]|nr:glycogen/starch synthase [Fimbriimonadaceae bacterium]